MAKQGEFSMNRAVRRIARIKGVKMVALAERLRIHRSTLRDTLNAGAPNVRTCERYADALGVSLLVLIQEGIV